MNMSKFAETVVKRMMEVRPDLEIRVNEIVKVNNVRLTALSISENGSLVCPNIYLDNYIEAYEHGAPLDFIVEDILSTYKNSRSSRPENLPEFDNYEKIRSSLFIKVINFERNKDFLKDKVYVAFGNLAALPYIELSLPCGAGTVNVTKDLAKRWNVETADVFEEAMSNSVATSQVFTMKDVLLELATTRKDSYDISDIENELEGNPMYIISNAVKCFGARSLLDLDLWKNFSSKTGVNFYIIPSSVHELIAIPDLNEEGTGEALTNMCMEVNNTVVDPTDYLADTVYYYDKERNMIVYALDKDSVVVSA